MISDDQIMSMTYQFGLHNTSDAPDLIAFARLIEVKVREELSKKFDNAYGYRHHAIAAFIRKGGGS